MRVEDLTITLRPRGIWETMDLGCALVRRDYGRILALWAATVVPVWILLAILMWQIPAWFSLVVWWLKPLYDRVPLYFLSRSAFGVKPGFRETWKQWPRLWSRFLFSALILNRLSLIRSFALPVLMLEGQKVADSRQRIKALGTDGWSAGFKATYTFLKLEFVVFFGLAALTWGLIPESDAQAFRDLFDGGAENFELSPAFYWWNNITYLLAITLIEPFYVGTGFALYLNCRMRLEGWDIELIFRKLATRVKDLVSKTANLLLCAGLLYLAGATPLQAESAASAGNGAASSSTAQPEKKEPVKAEPANEEARQAQEILAKPEFKVHSRTRKEWVPEIDLKESREVGSAVTSLFTILFWVIAIAVVAGLIYLLVVNRHLFRRPLAQTRAAEPFQGPRIIMGMDIGRDSLPADIIAAARALWTQGKSRDALSLLYRGALSRLVEQLRLPIRDSDTEDDCLLHVARSGGATGVIDYFRQLTLIWMRAAYAGLDAVESEFEKLCQDWPFQTLAAKGERNPPRSQSLFSQNASSWLWLGLTLLLLPSCGGKFVEITEEIGYKGKARSNPFLAAQMLLEEEGHITSRIPTLSKLPESGRGLIILSGESGIPSGRAKQILEWVEEGGQVIYFVAGAGTYSDWSSFLPFAQRASLGNEHRSDPLLDELGIGIQSPETTENNSKSKAKATIASPDEASKAGKTTTTKPDEILTEKVTWTWNDESYTVEMPTTLVLKYDNPMRGGDFRAGDPKKSRIISIQHGQGRVTVFNHARLFRSRYLAEHDHARLLLHLADEDSVDEVQFIISMEGSFWSLLWNRAWMALIALAVIILAWLWKNLRRFGPVRQAELHETKHFVDHISALGQFFHRLGKSDILLKASADAVRGRAWKRFPHLVQAGDEALVPLLATSSGLPAERIRAALSPQAASHPHQIVRYLQDLQSLRQAL